MPRSTTPCFGGNGLFLCPPDPPNRRPRPSQIPLLPIRREPPIFEDPVRSTTPSPGHIGPSGRAALTVSERPGIRIISKHHGNLFSGKGSAVIFERNNPEHHERPLEVELTPSPATVGLDEDLRLPGDDLPQARDEWAPLQTRCGTHQPTESLAHAYVTRGKRFSDWRVQPWCVTSHDRGRTGHVSSSTRPSFRLRLDSYDCVEDLKPATLKPRIELPTRLARTPPGLLEGQTGTGPLSVIGVGRAHHTYVSTVDCLSYFGHRPHARR
jgi:hypothetical protein